MVGESVVKRFTFYGSGRSARLNGTPMKQSDEERRAELRELPVELIDRNPAQPRRRFDQARLTALAESLETTGGVLQPITVRPHGSRYQLIAGERRWRASLIAGRPTVRAIVRDAEDTAAFELAAIENMVREDLTPARGGALRRGPVRHPRPEQGGDRPTRRPDARGDKQPRSAAGASRRGP